MTNGNHQDWKHILTHIAGFPIKVSCLLIEVRCVTSPQLGTDEFTFSFFIIEN